MVCSKEFIHSQNENHKSTKNPKGTQTPDMLSITYTRFNLSIKQLLGETTNNH